MIKGLVVMITLLDILWFVSQVYIFTHVCFVFLLFGFYLHINRFIIKGKYYILFNCTKKTESNVELFFYFVSTALLKQQDQYIEGTCFNSSKKLIHISPHICIKIHCTIAG